MKPKTISGLVIFAFTIIPATIVHYFLGFEASIIILLSMISTDLTISTYK